MQRTVRLWTNVLGAGLKLIVGLDIEVRGFENLPQGAAVIACKHLSAWDTFVFYRLARDPNYILKKELMEMPVWGWHARKCGAISVDRDGGAGALKQMVRDVEDRLSKDRQVIIFPEGTRTTPGEQLKFKRGAANIAARCEAPITSVLISMKPSTLTKGTPWYCVAATKAHFEMRFATDPFTFNDTFNNEQPAMQARQLTRDLQHYFSEELRHL